MDTRNRATPTAQREATWYVRRTRWDGMSDAIMSCPSQADAEASLRQLNSERDDTPYFCEPRG